jgi:hypothetical protein
VLFLICFGSRYYYDLELTLVVKSGVLVASGAVHLALWRFLGETHV